MKLSRLPLYPTLLPTDILGFLVIMFCFALWGEKIEAKNGCVVATAKESSWIKRKYPNMGAFTMGHFIFLLGEQPDFVLEHEYVHVKQLERNGIVAGVLSLGPALLGWQGALVGLGIFALSPFVIYAAAWMVALAYGQDIYYNNMDEEAAYDHVKANENK